MDEEEEERVGRGGESGEGNRRGRGGRGGADLAEPHEDPAHGLEVKRLVAVEHEDVPEEEMR